MGLYKVTQLQYHHPEGQFHGERVSSGDVILVFIPLINTVAFFALIGDWRHRRYKKEITFFKPRKPLK